MFSREEESRRDQDYYGEDEDQHYGVRSRRLFLLG